MPPRKLKNDTSPAMQDVCRRRLSLLGVRDDIKLEQYKGADSRPIHATYCHCQRQKLGKVDGKSYKPKTLNGRCVLKRYAKDGTDSLASMNEEISIQYF
jgi:hypothetical protein